jgi:hypothetical protein
VSALAQPQVGELVNRHFASTYVKVGTFALVNGQKQGGNVATYFCLPDGRMLHAIAGPVDAGTFLREARWAVHVHQRASLEGRDDPDRYVHVVQQAHVERLARNIGRTPDLVNRLLGQSGVSGRFAGRDPLDLARVQAQLSRHPHMGLDNQFQVHLLAAMYPLEKIEDIYQYVFESILGEKISSLPVSQLQANPYRGRPGAVKDEAIRAAVD